MRLAWIAGFVVGAVALLGVDTAALAMCSGASSPLALENFDKDPVAWIKANTGKADVGDQVLALAAAATNGNDSAFSSSFNTMLRNASGDDGTAIGKSLAGLVSTCSDSTDPGDKADKQYITENIEKNLPVNLAANTSYGNHNGLQSASTGQGAGSVGSGTGLGIGSIGSAPPSGSSSSGASPTGGTTATATASEAQPTASAGSAGATNSTGTTLGTGTTGTTTGTGTTGTTTGTGTTGTTTGTGTTGATTGTGTTGTGTTGGIVISNSSVI